MSLVRASICGGSAIVLIIIIRALWINRMPKRMIVVLWELSLLILSVPIGFGAARKPEALSSVVSELMPDIFIGQEDLEAATARDGASGFPALWAIWLAGALSLALFFAVSYIRCLREYKTAEIYTDGFLAEWLKAHALKRTVTVKVTGAVTSPMTYGIIRPVILLPKTLNIQNKEQLNYILLHEFCHIRRFDSLIKLWANAVLCIHWFNPLVWAMRSLLIRDIELRCDESVLNELGINSRKDYAMMLIELQEQRSGFSPIGSGIGKSAIAERIEAIMKYKKYKPAALFIVAAILVGALSFSVFAIDRAIGVGKSEREAEALEKEIAEAEGYEVLEMNSDGVCYVKMTPSPNGYDYEYDNFAFKGTVIFTDENGEPFNVVLGDKDNISITFDSNAMTESGETVGFIADGEDVKHVFHSKSSDPTGCKRWGLAYRFDEESAYTPYITSEDMIYVKSAAVIARTSVYISTGASEDLYLYDVPLEQAENITLGETVSAVFSKELTKDLKAGDNVKICVSFEHNDGEDLTWRMAAYRDDEEVPFEIKKGRLSDCEVEFDIPDGGDYVFRLINYSTNPVMVASAEIETER